MKAEGKQCTAIMTPPDGRYEGLWSGYCVKFSAEGLDYFCDTSSGIRGISTCTVTIEDGNVTIKTNPTV
jgi:hypothetical protein